MKDSIRLDKAVFERGLAESREKAQALIMSGSVYVDGQKALKSGTPVTEQNKIEVRGAALRYVSRGGLKLEKALKVFDVRPEGMTVLDIGASTGGFTDCLLQNGAAHVFSIDVGYGQLAWNIRQDKRVTVMERTNIRYVTPEQIGCRPQLAVIDVSFISLRLVLPVVKKLLCENGQVICLVKPQFEAGREKVGKKGVVRDPQVHKEVLDAFVNTARELGFFVCGLDYSPIKGPEGNIEYLGWLSASEQSAIPEDTAKIVQSSHSEHDASAND